MSADNDLDYWARTENPDKKELKRVLRRVADAADAIEIELHQLCAREEALLMGSRPRHPEELAKVRRERAAMRAKSKQARDEVEVMHLAIAGELSGAVALMRQRDEARAEVATAYRRGAEAMRDAAANALDMAGQGTLCDTRECEHWGRYVRALPIPVEP